jgi:hypothetical protein
VTAAQKVQRLVLNAREMRCRRAGVVLDLRVPLVMRNGLVLRTMCAMLVYEANKMQ